MKVKINPKYEQLRSFVESMPQETYSATQVYCENRNKVVRVEVQGVDMVVKRFKCPTAANRVIYTLFRKSKAERAYNNALRLTEAGFETAEPIAYVEVSHGLWFHTGYFVSVHLPHPRLDEIVHNIDDAERELLTEDLLDFIDALYAKGIYQQDNNAGNFLVHKENGHYRFAMVDINRIKFNHQVTYRESMLPFAHLGSPDDQSLRHAVRLYSERHGYDMEQSMFYVLLHRQRRRITRGWIAGLKKFFHIGNNRKQ